MLIGATYLVAGEPTVEKGPGVCRCRLVNVTIPPDSPHRHATNINHPPALYIIIKRNGVQIGKHSTIHDGWSIDFPSDAPVNQWDIVIDDGRYSIELWDSNWGGDDLALSITGLKAKEFTGDILEQGGKGTAKDRLVRVTFEVVLSTEGAGKTK